MALKQFKAESKRLMDLMINSIYTHKEIFLRELISNASDAIDKLYYRSLQEGISGLDRGDFFIRVQLDKEARTITISDNGIGMTKEELDSNLGVIAKSGSMQFKEQAEARDDVDVIGQFGVGFYSAFMVSDRVTVESMALGSEESWLWTSAGLEGYQIKAGKRTQRGTTVTLHLKEDTEDERYSEFLETPRITGLIKKYSDYIRYPIRMEVSRSQVIPGTGEGEEPARYESVTAEETINSMTPIWKRSRSEVGEEELAAFYKEKFFDWQDPLRIIRSNTEGAATYSALLFIPAGAPYDYYSREYEKGLQLYASGVLIMEKCPDLLPDCFSFVRGLVDSQDLSLNISREMLQHDRQLKLIASRLEKKIASELASMLANEREKYEKFWENFGLQLKYGVYENFGAKKDELKDLLLFVSSAEKKPVTLKEYLERMPEDQSAIYYGCGETVERVLALPQAESLLAKGYELLCLTDNIDEFALRVMESYGDKPFVNIAAGDFDLSSEEEKEKLKESQEQAKDLLAALKEALSDKVVDVRLSAALKSSAVCLSTEGAISAEMERVLNAIPAGQRVQAQRVLELNPEHPVFGRLRKLAAENPEKLADYAQLLYGQALLLEGVLPEDPADFARRICDLMA